MLVGIAIPLKTDVVRLACVFVCYICYPTVEKGPNSNLSSLILLHLRIPLNRNEILKNESRSWRTNGWSRKRERMNFHILSLKPSEVQASSWKNISNSNSTTQIDESWSTKLGPPSSYPLKSWSIELDLFFTWSTKVPKICISKPTWNATSFFRSARAPHWSASVFRRVFGKAGALFLFENCSRPAGFGPKKRNFQAATWCGQPPLDSGLTPHGKSPQSFSKWPSATGFPSKTR